MSEIQMRVSGISKSFPGVKALSNIDFAVRKGTVHALCGENGAGKSTLMKIINGLYKADEGQVFIDEKPVEIKKLAIPHYTASQLADKARKAGDAPDIVRDSITKVTLFDYSDIIGGDEESEE